MKSNALLTVASATLAAAVPAQMKTHIVRQESSGSNKKGLAYEDAGVLDSFAGQVSWAYDWSSRPGSSSIQGVPMCWGSQRDCNGQDILAQIHEGGASWVLGYNEPDMVRGEHFGGSQLTPKQAFDAWGNDMFPFDEAGAKLVCPGITSHDAHVGAAGYESGLKWLRKFVSLAGSPSDLRCDAQGIHWYGPDPKDMGGVPMGGSDQADLFIEYMRSTRTTVKEIFGRDMPIWVTEFGPFGEGDVSLLRDFMNKAVPFLESQDWITHYSPFKPEQMVTGSSLNEAGRAFLNPQGPQS